MGADTSGGSSRSVPGKPSPAHPTSSRSHGCEVSPPIAARRRVHQHPEFEADFVSQLAWLIEHGERSWVTNFFEGMAELVETLRDFPAAGAIKDQRRGSFLRQLRHPRGPYLVWYVTDENEPNAEVWLVRLFHIRQRRPAPDVGRWSGVRK